MEDVQKRYLPCCWCLTVWVGMLNVASDVFTQWIFFLLVAIEASSPRKEPKCILLPSQMSKSDGTIKNCLFFIWCLILGYSLDCTPFLFELMWLVLQMLYQLNHRLTPVKECASWWRFVLYILHLLLIKLQRFHIVFVKI